MADRRPLVTPGRVDELDDADRAIVSGIVRTAAGDLTFEDAVTGSKTLAQLATAGSIGGTTGSTAGLIVTATAVADEVEASAVDIADVSGHLADTDIHVPAFGTAGQVLTVNVTEDGAEWATPAAGGSTTLTGDVTGTGTGTIATTIANNAVTYAKMQNVSAASRLLGRGSAAGAGDPQELTAGAGILIAGTVVSAANLIHAVNRSVQITGVAGTPVFPGFDVTHLAADTSYVTYSAGTWTIVKDCTLMIETQASFKVNAGAAGASLSCDIVLNSVTNLQTHESGAYSTTTLRGQVCNRRVYAFSAGNTFRIYYYTSSGIADILANENTCYISRIAG